MSTSYIHYPPKGVPIFASAVNFPPSAQIGALAVAADTGGLYEWRGSSWVLLADPGTTPLAITALTGDVSATGPGAVAATVNFVGGKSAASIATSVNDTQAATPLNTPSTIVKRDGAGSFASQDISLAGLLTVVKSISVGPNGANNVFLNVNTENSGAGDRGVVIEQHTNTTAGPLVSFKHSRGTTASPVTLANLDESGKLQGQGYDGTGYITTWQIMSRTNGAVSTGIIPTDLNFFVRDATGAINQALQIKNDQTIKLNGGVLDMNSNLAINGLDPVSPQDLATKAYVDANTPGPGPFLRLDGGNSPTAAISWGAQDLNSVDTIRVNKTVLVGPIAETVPDGTFLGTIALQNAVGDPLAVLGSAAFPGYATGEVGFQDSNVGYSIYLGYENGQEFITLFSTNPGNAFAQEELLKFDNSGGFTQVNLLPRDNVGSTLGDATHRWESLHSNTVKLAYTSQAASYVATASDSIIGINDTSAPRTVTLASAAALQAGTIIYIKDESGAAVTNNITISSADNIDGMASVVISQSYGAVRLYCTGSTYFSI